MRNSVFLSGVIAIALFGALLHATCVVAAPPSVDETTFPLASPALPVERLAIVSPYSLLGAGAVDDVAEYAAGIEPRGTITERMTSLAQSAGEKSPYHGTTWLTYYGRPGIPVMGILGEYEADELTELLVRKAREYEVANGRSLRVQPAFHLVYGMATVATGDDGSHLAYLEDDVVMGYITRAAESNIAVILDVQIGNLSPTESISNALPYLAHEHVHLAIDPEFAMAHEGQTIPGNPIGYVTGEQVNEVQSTIQRYMRKHRLKGERVLLVHQFQSNMIMQPEEIDVDYPQVAVTISVDGWGGPWAKVSKYNSLVTPDSPFVSFKLFYGWDEPLLTPAQALGEEEFPDLGMMIDVTPNMIIYQ